MQDPLTPLPASLSALNGWSLPLVLCAYLALVGMGVATVVAVIRLIIYLCTC